MHLYVKRKNISSPDCFVVFLLAVSAIGYLFFPSAMLSVVGMTSNNQTDFLVRTLAAALVALIPSAWQARKAENSALFRNVILGLAIYMFLSSAVDLHAYLIHLVNSASVPSVIFRVGMGAILLWLMPKEIVNPPQK
jgi:cell division protein FtsW (lipid II flippase)